MKKLALWFVLVALLYGFFESAAWVGYRLLFGEVFSFSHMEVVRKERLAALSMATKPDGAAPVYLLHPYYGYVINPRWIEAYRRQNTSNDAGRFRIHDPINPHGFFGDSPPLQPRDRRKLVVAVAGGSVAAYAGSWGRQAFIEGLKQVPAFKDREIVLLNFGQPAYKQPQQLMVIGDILSQGGHIDLLINIDGFNEIALPRAHDAFGSRTSPFFPQLWKLTSETSFSRDAMVRLGLIALLQRERARWLDRVSRFPLRNSIAVATVWRVWDENSIKRKVALERGLEQSAGARLSNSAQTTDDGRTFLGPPNSIKDARELYQASATLWARSSVLLNNMLASQGSLYVHVLQPNQYFPGSKPMGSDEARIALAPNSPYKAEVERGYPYLRSAGKSLSESGVRFFDLTTLFQDESAPLYIDACCHFSEDGNAKLVKAIILRVADTLRESPLPRHAIFSEADFSLNALRALSLTRDQYVDGSGESVLRTSTK